jgi:hypothetical protein
MAGLGVFQHVRNGGEVNRHRGSLAAFSTDRMNWDNLGTDN